MRCKTKKRNSGRYINKKIKKIKIKEGGGKAST
jgi:hypothetical protein